MRFEIITGENFNTPRPPLVDIVYFSPLCIPVRLTVLERVY